MNKEAIHFRSIDLHCRVTPFERQIMKKTEEVTTEGSARPSSYYMLR